MAVTAAEFPTGAHAADADSQSDQSGISDVEDELDKLDLQATSDGRHVLKAFGVGPNFQSGSRADVGYQSNAGKRSAAILRSKDRSDRATVEQALDPRTRMVLFKMLNRGLFCDLHGCISTGKEANVYHAVDAADNDLAVKVYKTSILVFKDRDRYVTGDNRFRSYCKTNPRKMVKVWAEKELRNLARLSAAGVRCPKPITLQMHVLVMEFIGSGGVAAPRLKDADVTPAQLRGFYLDMVLLIRTLYQTCSLVHADLSEYNILVHQGELYIIDVSQSVDLDHPRALHFLREDIQHVNAFFHRAGVPTLTMRELFDFVLNASVTPDSLDAEVQRLMDLAASRPLTRTAEEGVEESVFHQAFIPRQLHDVVDFERVHDRMAVGGAEAHGVYYDTISGMMAEQPQADSPAQHLDGDDRQDVASVSSECSSPEDNTAIATALQPDAMSAVGTAEQQQQISARLSKAEISAADDDDDDQCSISTAEDSSSVNEVEHRNPVTVTKEDRKTHKKAVKEAARERRKTKMPKHVKKRATKHK